MNNCNLLPDKLNLNMKGFGNSYCREISLWKWILLFLGGVILFLLLYSGAQTASMTEMNTPLKICISLVAASLLVMVYYLVVGKIEKRKVDELITISAGSWAGKGLLCGIGYFSIITAILAIFGMYSIDGYDFNVTNLIERFVFFLVIAVGEEIIFRGIIFRMIAERWNVAAALIVSSLLFGVMHIFNPDASIWSSIAIAIEAGLLLGAAYSFSGNLWLPIGIHWTWNFMEGNIFGFDVSGSPESYRLLTPSISGPDILTGGGFGPEASIIALVLGGSLSFWFIWKYYKAHGRCTY